MREVEFPPQESGAIVRAVRADGSQDDWQARFVVDASGRDTFLANRFKRKQRNPKHNSSALYGHFRGAVLPGGPPSRRWFCHLFATRLT